MHQRYFIRPLEHALTTDAPKINQQYSFGAWPSKDFSIKQRSIQKRWGYSEDRDLGEYVYDVAKYEISTGSRYTVYLTEDDIAIRTTGTDETWQYLTETWTTDTIASISGATVTKTAGTTWVDNVAVGDFFILNDDHSAAKESDTNWATIKTVDGANQITLTASYTGTTGSSWTKAYKIRKIYAVPDNEAWDYCIVNNKMVAVNGSIQPQYWSGSNYFANIDDSDTINKARYCIEYGNRVLVADYGTTRAPTSVAWSSNTDITEWDSGVDTTAGQNEFKDTGSFITGLGKIGPNIIVYFRDLIVIGYRTGESDAPFSFPTTKPGIGLVAPRSLIEFNSTNAFVGDNNFYKMEGTTPVILDEQGKMREKFFDIVGKTEITKTFGFHNKMENELVWVANTKADGKLAFAYNYLFGEWCVYNYADDITCGGVGAI